MYFSILRFLSSIVLFSVIISLAFAQQPASTSIQKDLAALEISFGGRLGIAALDTATNERIQYRGTERFPMGCTSKVMGVAAVLKKSMTINHYLQEKISYGQKDLLEWAPITKNHLADGMTVGELCAAAISYSDNTAMNLLAEKLGGPSAINTFAKSIGDTSFKLDHWWPKEAMANTFDSNDSSTPAAMVFSLQKLALGNVLAAPQREKLIIWLKNNTTGEARIRAGIPKGWVVGDKTGTGFEYGTANDIAIIWPPHCDPIIVALFTTSTKKSAAKRDDIIANATRLLISEFSRSDHCIVI